MEKMEATSFFAQLRRGRHGPIPRERSPSPLPVVCLAEDNIPKNPEVVTIDDVEDKTPTSKDVPDGDASSSQNKNRPRVNNSNSQQSSGGQQNKAPLKDINNSGDSNVIKNNNFPAAGLMQLPFPPGMDGIKNNAANNTGGPPGQANNIHFTLYDNLLGASEALKNSMKKQKVMSITKDLPMPPGKIYFFKLY